MRSRPGYPRFMPRTKSAILLHGGARGCARVSEGGGGRLPQQARLLRPRPSPPPLTCSSPALHRGCCKWGPCSSPLGGGKGGGGASGRRVRVGLRPAGPSAPRAQPPLLARSHPPRPRCRRWRRWCPPAWLLLVCAAAAAGARGSGGSRSAAAASQANPTLPPSQRARAETAGRPIPRCFEPHDATAGGVWASAIARSAARDSAHLQPLRPAQRRAEPRCSPPARFGALVTPLPNGRRQGRGCSGAPTAARVHPRDEVAPRAPVSQSTRTAHAPPCAGGQVLLAVVLRAAERPGGLLGESAAGWPPSPARFLCPQPTPAWCLAPRACSSSSSTQPARTMPWPLLVWLLAFVLQSGLLGICMYQLLTLSDLGERGGGVRQRRRRDR